MKSKSKLLVIIFPIICYWFYSSICFGYFLSKIFSNFFDEIDKTCPSKSIKFRKKFSLKNIVKMIIHFFWKIIKNWFTHIWDKGRCLLAAAARVIQGLKIFIKKFKSVSKFKRNFRLLKNLLHIFRETGLIIYSLLTEIFFLSKRIEWMIQLIDFILFSMKESIFITRIIYFLYLILLGIFGIMIGFLLGIYKIEDKINPFLLLEIIYNEGFNDVLLEYSHDLSLETQIFSKFSVKSLQQIDPRPLKIIFKEPELIPLPFFIIEDSFIFIETEVLWHEATNYQFELFKLFRHINQKEV